MCVWGNCEIIVNGNGVREGSGNNDIDEEEEEEEEEGVVWFC